MLQQGLAAHNFASQCRLAPGAEAQQACGCCNCLPAAGTATVCAMPVLRCAQRGSAAALCRCWSASTAGTAPGPHSRPLGWQHRRALRKRYRRSAPLSAATDAQVRLRFVLTCSCQVCLGDPGHCQQARRSVPPVATLLALCSLPYSCVSGQVRINLGLHTSHAVPEYRSICKEKQAYKLAQRLVRACLCELAVQCGASCCACSAAGGDVPDHRRGRVG